MTTFYIDPDSGGGPGTSTSPFKNWTTATFTAGNTYLQKAGTIYTSSIVINTPSISLGVYDPATGQQITSGSSTATINATGFRWSIRIGTDVKNVSVDRFECTGADTGTTVFGIYVGDGACDYTSITNCYLHDIADTASGDSNLLRIAGNFAYVAGNRVSNGPDDGIFINGQGAVVRDNVVSNIGTNASRTTGDGIQITGSSNSAGSYSVLNNYIDHSSTVEKQGIVVTGTSGSGGTISSNTVLFPPDTTGTSGVSCILLDTPNAQVLANYIRGSNYGINIDTGGLGITVKSNVVVSSYVGITNAGTPTGGQILNNTVLYCTTGINMPPNDSTTAVKNNIAAYCQKGITTNGNVIHDYNLYFENSLNDWTTTGGFGRTDEHGLFIDPQLDSRFAPLSRQVRVSGTDVGGGVDFYGNTIGNPPAIGAVQFPYRDNVLSTPQLIAGGTLKFKRDKRKG